MDRECPPLTDVSRRPEMFLPPVAFDSEDGPRPEWLFAGTDIMVIGRYLSCYGQSVDYTDCEVTLRLFRAFCAAKDGRCSLRDVLRFVYAIDDLDACSKRYRKSVRARAVKLISRSRRQLHALFVATPAARYEWFGYDREHRVWVLCQLRRVEYFN